jgi:hypothetical protein
MQKTSNDVVVAEALDLLIDVVSHDAEAIAKLGISLELISECRKRSAA